MVRIAQEPPHFPSAGRQGTVKKAPASRSAPMQVVVPSFDKNHIYEIRRWVSRGMTLPVKGDQVLVVEDEEGEPWVVAWWSTSVDAGHDKGFVFHGADVGEERPAGYASVEWVGSVEPANALDGDTWIVTV